MNAATWKTIVITVLIIDGLLLGGHALHRAQGSLVADGLVSRLLTSGAAWNGTWDGSLVEQFGQLQLSATAILLLLTAAELPRHGVLAAWGYTFVVLAADDAFRLHEQISGRLGLDYSAPYLTGTGTHQIGSPAVWVLIALPIGAVLAATHAVSSSDARYGSRRILLGSMPFIIVAVSYNLVGATSSPLLYGMGGGALAMVRMTVKLLTATWLMLQALSLYTRRDRLRRGVIGRRFEGRTLLG